MPIPLRSDRSAWDDIDYGNLHSRDIDQANHQHHLPVASDVGDLPTWDGDSWVAQQPTSGSGGGGHTIEDETTPLTQRTKLSFQGAGVTATDDSGNDRTIVTIPTPTVDAADVTYTPADVTDWDLDTDPGNVDDALDQLATRLAGTGLPWPEDGWLEFWVDPVGGDDGNDGSSGSPFQNLWYAMDVIQLTYAPGTTARLWVFPGTHESFSVSDYPGSFNLRGTGGYSGPSGVPYMHGGKTLHTPSSLSGNGDVTLSTNNGGTGGRIRVTVTCSVDNPSFGTVTTSVKVLVWDGSTLTEYSGYSASGNVITLDSTATAPTLNVDGCYIVIEPSAIIDGGIYIGGANVLFQDVYIKGTYQGLLMKNNSFARAENCIFQQTAGAGAGGAIDVRQKSIFTDYWHGIGVDYASGNTFISDHAGIYIESGGHTDTPYSLVTGGSYGIYCKDHGFAKMRSTNVPTGVNIGAYASNLGSIDASDGTDDINFATTQYSPATSETFGNNGGLIVHP